MPVSRLSLTDFRSYALAEIEPGPGFVLLYGENGAGKTNVLEAVSLLTPGRGLRGAALSEMARHGGDGGFAVRRQARRDRHRHRHLPSAPERRQVRINGAAAAVNSLSEWLSVLWLTPAMDRLFGGSAGDRRRFLDRLVLALEPSHAHHSARYDAAMRARNKLLAEERGTRCGSASLELAMAEHGRWWPPPARGRWRRSKSGSPRCPTTNSHGRRSASKDGMAAISPLASRRTGRATPARAARSKARIATTSPCFTAPSKSPRRNCSTGEQKALLLGLVLAHGELVADRRGAPPILLLDEVAAHLDPKRRAALFTRLEGRGQVWMTATEAALFDGIGPASRFRIEPGIAHPE